MRHARQGRQGLFEELAEEREHEEREDRAPDEGVEDHERPPENAAVGRTQGIGHGESGLSEESLEDEEQDEVQHAQRHVGEQKRFH